MSFIHLFDKFILYLFVILIFYIYFYIMTHRISFTEKELAYIHQGLTYLIVGPEVATTEEEHKEIGELIDKVHEFIF